MSLKELLEKKKAKYKNKLGLALEEVAEDARDYAPFGSTGQLRAGITPLKVIETRSNLVGVIISSAKDESGREYAEIQNSAVLRHASPRGSKATKSFKDFSTIGGSFKSRYSQGYRLAKGSAQKYATKYLLKGFESAKRRVIKIIESK